MTDPLNLEEVPSHVTDRLDEEGLAFLRRWLDFIGPIPRIGSVEDIRENLGEHLVDGVVPADTLRVLLFEEFTNYSIIASRIGAILRNLLIIRAIERSVPHRDSFLATVHKKTIDALPEAALHYTKFAVLVRTAKFMLEKGVVRDDPTRIYSTLLDIKLHALILMLYQIHRIVVGGRSTAVQFQASA